MEFLKKFSIGSYVLVAAAVLGLVALIVGGVSCAGEGFGMDEMPAIVIFTIFAILLTAAAVVLSAKYGEKSWIAAMVFVVVLFLALGMYFMLMGKTDVMGTVMFSDLEKGYKPAEDACYIGLTSVVIYIVATLFAVVGAFFSLVKKD